ncbi:hypothetical protein [Oceanobacillus sojae]|uniref:hypothetical protein n=1 Tax=Oceanobacillus sojae TaxID=582851 RepID=UPI00362B103F
MKKLFLAFLLIILLAACGDNSSNESNSSAPAEGENSESETKSKDEDVVKVEKSDSSKKMGITTEDIFKTELFKGQEDNLQNDSYENTEIEVIDSENDNFKMFVYYVDGSEYPSAILLKSDGKDLGLSNDTINPLYENLDENIKEKTKQVRRQNQDYHLLGLVFDEEVDSDNPPKIEDYEIVRNTDSDQDGSPTTDWETVEFGDIRYVGFGYNDEAGIDGSDEPIKAINMPPMKLYIENVSVIDVKPNQEYKDIYFDGKSDVRAIVATIRAENTSDDDVNFYPHDSILTTDTGEQLEPNWMLTDLNGEYFGKVKKEGEIWWFLESDQDISTAKIILSPPYSMDSWEDLSEEKRLEFEILDFDEATKRDESN